MASPTVRCQAFLSWNKEENKAYTGFIEKLRDEFKSKGIDLTSVDHDVEDEIRRSSIAIVFMTNEYASSRKCIDHLISLVRLHARVCPIYLDPSSSARFNRNESFSCYAFNKLALHAAGVSPEEHMSPLDDTQLELYHAIQNSLSSLFFGYRWWPKPIKSFLHPGCDESIFISEFVDKTLNRMNPFNINFQDENLAQLQPSLLQISAALLDFNDHLTYVGILGTDPSTNSLISKWLYGRMYSSFSVVNYITLDSEVAANCPQTDPSLVKYIPPENNLRNWAAYVLYMHNYSLRAEKCTNFHSICLHLSRFPSGSFLLIIDGLDTLDRFLELYKVLAILGSKSKVIFTTCNSDIFSLDLHKWTCGLKAENRAERFFELRQSQSEIMDLADAQIADALSVKLERSTLREIQSMCDVVSEGDETDDSMSEDEDEEEVRKDTEGGIDECESKGADCVTENKIYVTERKDDVCKGNETESTHPDKSAADVEEARKKMRIC